MTIITLWIRQLSSNESAVDSDNFCAVETNYYHFSTRQSPSGIKGRNGEYCKPSKGLLYKIIGLQYIYLAVYTNVPQ